MRPYLVKIEDVKSDWGWDVTTYVVMANNKHQALEACDDDRVYDPRNWVTNVRRIKSRKNSPHVVVCLRDQG